VDAGVAASLEAWRGRNRVQQVGWRYLVKTHPVRTTSC